MNSRERKYLGVGYDPEKLSLKNTNAPLYRFYNNGTIITDYILNFPSHMTGDGYAAGRGTDWLPINEGILLGATVINSASPLKQGHCRLGDGSDVTKAGKKYQINQNCWWPVNPCCSIQELDQ